MTQIVCLANSWKHKERCIAGIETNTGKWIRPVYGGSNNGAIPQQVRSLNGQEPKILDVIELSLRANTCQLNYAVENQQILPGNWTKLGTVKPVQLIKYTNFFAPILHNYKRYVTVSFLKSLPLIQRRTLQLIYTSKLEVLSERKSDGRIKWKGNLVSNFGYKLENASITDPEFVKRLVLGHQSDNLCLITVSLSLPFCPDETWQEIEPCWKLIAGVIELD